MSALIIPSFIKNGWDLQCIERLLASVGNQTVPFERVFVVDDASPFDHVIENGFVEHIRLPANGGPANARNVGIQRALDLGVRHLLFTDHDCILDRAWNEEMSRFLDHEAFGAVDEACTVWVNDKRLLERPYPYKGNTDSWQEAFEVDVSEVVRYGVPNTVAVRVSDNTGAGGIWRPVWVTRTAAPVVAAANLVRDSGFEGKAAAWGRSTMAGTFQFAVDTDHAHGGMSSGRLECTERGTAEDLAVRRNDVWGRWHQSGITIDPTASHRLRIWVRTPVGFVSRIAIWVTGTTDGTTATNVATTGGRWHEVTVEGIKAKGDRLGIYLNLMDAPGVAWFDDVELVAE